MMTEIKTVVIKLTGWNPRKTFDPDELNELKSSIEEYGILEPLIVRPLNGFFELVAGERRYRAACELKLETVPVVVKELTDSQVHEIMLIENLQRSQLQPLEEAQSLEVLLQEDITQEQLAKKLGKSQSWVANRLRLLQAPDKVIDMLISREITPKHVMVLLPFRDYPLIFDKVLKRYDVGDSVIQLKDELDSVIRWERDCTIDIDDPGWDYRNDDIDISGCAECEDILDESEGDDLRRYCLNVECWDNMVDECRAARKDEIKKINTVDCIDVSALGNDEFEYLTNVVFNISECDSCETSGVNLNNSKICLNPDCFNGKSAAYHDEQKAIAEREQIGINGAITKWTASKVVLLGEDLRLVLVRLLNSGYGPNRFAAFEPWYIAEEFDDGDAIAAVPDTDLSIAIMRLVVYLELPAYGSMRESFTKDFPDVAKFYGQQSLSDLEVPA